MERTENVIFTNMCMVYDGQGNILVEDRVRGNWRGIAFPGGHVEPGEPFTDAAIREIYEETGLTVSRLQLCAIKDWIREDGIRYVVALYKTSCFEGDLRSSDEGRVFWMSMEEFLRIKPASGMHQSLKAYLDDTVSEQFFYQENGEWIGVLK